MKNIKEILNGLNFKKRIKIRVQINQDSASLYLDFFNGVGKREYKFLKLNLIGKKKQDDTTLKLACSIRDKKELELFSTDNELQLKNPYDKLNFITYFEAFSKKSKKNDDNYHSILGHLKDFSPHIPMKSDKQTWEKFKKYLLSKVSQNTASVYFSKIKAVYNKAVADEIISKNYAQHISIKMNETERFFLTFQELQILQNTECENINSKNAFLFSCFTGLRISDIKKLTFNNIDDIYASFRQQKTKGLERNKLSQTALEILNIQKKIVQNKNLIFSLKTVSTIEKHIAVWVKKAGIKKHITFHCGRHTFATMCITNGIDIFTLKELLGHRDINSTLVYAKLINQKRDEAIDKLPHLII